MTGLDRAALARQLRQAATSDTDLPVDPDLLIQAATLVEACASADCAICWQVWRGWQQEEADHLRGA